MLKYLNKPYNLLEIKKFKILYSFGIWIFCFLFLYIFEPFGLYNISGLYKLKIISLYVFFGLLISVIHLFWLQNIVIKKFTLRNTILWISWITFLTSISSSIINDITSNQGHFHIVGFIVYMGIIFGITIIPMSLLILAHYIYTIKKQIKISSQINKKILEKSKISNGTETITIEASNKRENISLLINNFLYITSADNYIDVYYLEGNAIKHNLLRNTLNNIEKQTSNNQSIHRCHKSYIVNMTKIDSVLGNASGYKINLKNTDLLIPISRKYKENIFSLLNR